MPGADGSPPAAYWDRSRLLGALPFIHGHLHVPVSGQSADPHVAGILAGLRVGAFFLHEGGGDHFCTASVVASPGKDLLITAAHCINGGKNGGYRRDIVFIPDYRDGQEPFGIWTPAKLIVAAQWADASDPDYARSAAMLLVLVACPASVMTSRTVAFHGADLLCRRQIISRDDA